MSRGVRTRRAVLLVCLLLGVVPARPAGAVAGHDDPQETTSRPLVAEALGGLSPLLVGTAVEGAGYPAAYDAWTEAGSQLVAADRQRASGEELVAELVWLGERRAEEVEAARRHADRTAEVEAGARAQLIEMAVGAFMLSEASDRPGTGLDLGSEQGDRRRLVLGDEVTASTIQRHTDAEAAAAAAAAAAADARARLDRVVAEHRAAEVALADADRRTSGWAEERARRQEVLADLGAATRVAGINLRTVVVDAYARGSRHPDVTCSLPWSVLAGIGRVETRHGEHGGSAPDRSGQVVPRIVGIPLDGDNDTMEIRDTDGGRHDGDTVYDRAVGPMQFIPSTWSRHGVDGNGDGLADPDNLYDAAASAAVYLCRSMPADGDVARAILAYNRDRAYVDAVLGHSAAYAAVRIPAVPDPPVA